MLDFFALDNNEINIANKLLSIKPKKLTPSIYNYLKKHKVYISLTTGPIRLRKLPAVLNLLDLSLVNEIHINLPLFYRNKNDQTYNQQDIDLVNMTDSRIKIFRINEDIGPLTKIIPTLKRIKDPLAIIISIDDDIGYPFNLISSLIYHSIKKPQHIFTGAAFRPGDYPNSNFNKSLLPNNFKIIEGWGAIAYKKSIINSHMINQIIKLNKLSTHCKLSDDFTISYILASNGIKSFEVNGIRNKLEPFNYGTGEDALHKGSGVNTTGSDDENMQKYHTCLNDIHLSRIKKRRSKRS